MQQSGERRQAVAAAAAGFSSERGTHRVLPYVSMDHHLELDGHGSSA